MSARREGERIRHENGMGYGDRVSDEEILQHIARDMGKLEYLSSTAEHLQFAIDTLALRATERLAASVGGQR